MTKTEREEIQKYINGLQSEIEYTKEDPALSEQHKNNVISVYNRKIEQYKKMLH